MRHRPANAVVRTVSIAIFLAAISSSAWSQKPVHCPDGDHIQIDTKQIAIKYDASSFAGTLSSLSILGVRLEVAPAKLQEAAVATQQWNEFVKGLAEGYNSCAVTRQQYADGLNRIYPRLKEDAADLDAIRKAISEGQKADAKRLQTLLDSYWNNLRQFAQASGKEIVLQRIDALSEQVASGQGQILQREDLILAKLNELEQRSAKAPVPTPAEVGKEISEVRKELLAKSDAAEQAYNKGYELLDQYRFRDAIPYLQQALAAVPLPDFYAALGSAYWELPDLPQAQSTLKQGLTAIAGKGDNKHEALLATLLGGVLVTKGDLDGGLTYTKRALEIDEKVYGPDHPNVATDANNIGQILGLKQDLDGALTYTKRALEIDEKVYGPDHPNVATDANNISLILKAKGDLDGALTHAARALKIYEKVYGPDHPVVAVGANNIGQILKDKGDLERALTYTQKALRIGEKVYGPDYPNVAIFANNIGQILKDKGDLDGALSYTKRALEIDEKVYGPDHPSVAVRAHNISRILGAKGDLDGALTYAQRALDIMTKSYGPDHPLTRGMAADLKQIKQAKEARQLQR
jgi:tetratricopeptide (TPR) repeat protein